MRVTNAILAVDGDVVRINRDMKDVVLAKTSDAVQKASDAVDRDEASAYEGLKAVKESYLGPKDMVDDIGGLLAAYKPIRDRVIALSKDGKADEAATIVRTEGTS